MSYNTIADQTLEQFQKRLVRVIGDLQNKIATELSGLQTINGRAALTADNLQYTNQLYQRLIVALNEAGYSDVVRKLQSTDADIIKAFRSSVSVPLAFTDTSRDVINALRLAEFNQFQVIGEQAMSRIREEVMRTVLTGTRLEDSLSAIRESLDSKFQRYAYTYANTTRRDVIQAVQDESARQYDGDLYWEYVGPDDNITRPACQDLLAIRYFTNEEREQYESETADERAYNCRHIFMQITEQEYNDAVGK